MSLRFGNDNNNQQLTDSVLWTFPRMGTRMSLCQHSAAKFYSIDTHMVNT